jgi:hypothetical protein
MRVWKRLSLLGIAAGIVLLAAALIWGVRATGFLARSRQPEFADADDAALVAEGSALPRRALRGAGRAETTE